MYRFALGLAAALVSLSVACAAPSGDPDSTPTEEAAGQTQEAMTSSGFICNGGGCVCDPDSDNPIDSCDGMMDFCDRIGPGMLCEPGGWCFCKVWSATAGTASTTDTGTGGTTTKAPRTVTGTASTLKISR
jgi:hypothetical protein